MANRGTFSSILPRDIKRQVDLSIKNPPEFKKRIQVEVVNTKTGEKKQQWVIQKDYQNDLRALFVEAHNHHKAFKLKRLAKEDVGDSKDIVEATTEVSAT